MRNANQKQGDCIFYKTDGRKRRPQIPRMKSIILQMARIENIRVIRIREEKIIRVIRVRYFVLSSTQSPETG